MKLNQKPVKVSLGEYLRQGREAAELTLRQVEQLSGISNAQVSLIECGRTANPSALTVFRLVKLYKLKLQDIEKILEDENT